MSHPLNIIIVEKEGVLKSLAIKDFKQEELYKKCGLINDIDAFLKPYFEPNEVFRFTARVDLITISTVWELKCTTQISIDHKLQTIIYAWLWKMLNPGDPRDIKILNIKTGEIIKLVADMDELNHIMLLLLKGKFREPIIKTDEEFIHDCREHIVRL